MQSPLLFGEAGSLFSQPGRKGPLLKSGIPAWASPLCRIFSAAAELFVINLVAQHNPQANAQFPGCRHPGLAHSFLNELATIEAFQLRVFPYRVHRCFGPEITQQGIALLGHLSQSLSLAAGVLAWDHADVAGYFFPV